MYQLVLRTIEFLTQQKHAKDAKDTKGCSGNKGDEDITGGEVGFNCCPSGEVPYIFWLSSRGRLTCERVSDATRSRFRLPRVWYIMRSNKQIDV